MSVVDGELQTRTYKHCVIVTAAGSSNRFNEKNNLEVKKEFIELEGMPILSHAVKPFLEFPDLQAVVITYRKDFKQSTINSLKALDAIKRVPFYFVEGGRTRQDSVFNALKFVHENLTNIELVSIHDGARPFVTKNIIKDCLNFAQLYGGAAPCTPMTDTLVKVSNGFVSSRLDRTEICGIQTPQTFIFSQIYNAHVLARNSHKIYTDDSEIFMDYCEPLGFKVAAVPSTNKNRKITYLDDLETTK